jgi:hypothetical protein
VEYISPPSYAQCFGTACSSSGRSNIVPLDPLAPQDGADFPGQIRGSTLQPKSKQFRQTWLLAFTTAILFCFTMFYANTVLISVSPVPHFFSLSPGKTITVVNVLSHGVAFLLLQLTGSVFEALRWALASSRSGISLMSFLALGPATSILGVLGLCRKIGVHLIWCIQRYSLSSGLPRIS